MKAVHVVDAIEFVCSAAEQRPEAVGVGVGESGEDVLFDAVEALMELGEQSLSLGGGNDVAGPSVVGVDLALDEPSFDEIVDEVGHDRSIDGEAAGECDLAGCLAALDLEEQLIGARPAR